MNKLMDATLDPVDLYLGNLSAIRREGLRILIKERTRGNVSKFAAMTGFSRAQVAQFLSPTYSSGRSIGERAARTLEHRTGLPWGWLDYVGPQNEEVNISQVNYMFALTQSRVLDGSKEN